MLAIVLSNVLRAIQRANGSVYISLVVLSSSVTTSIGSSAVTKTVGAKGVDTNSGGYDYLYFISGTFSSEKIVDTSINWTFNVCVGSAYTANQQIRVRWEIVSSDGTTVQESGSEQTWSNASGGAQCDTTASAAARNKTGNSPGGTMGSEGTQLGFKGTGLKRKN